MKNKQNKPENIKLSIIREKINTVIERDIAFVVLIMVLGLLNSDAWGMRGLPLTWIHLGRAGAHTLMRPVQFVLDLIIIIAVVAAGEVLASISKRASEPVAFRNQNRTPSYANIFDDSDISPDTGIEHQEITDKLPSEMRKALENARSRAKTNARPAAPARRQNKSSGKLIFNLVIIAFIVMFASVIIFFSMNDYDDINIEADDTDEPSYSYDYESFYESAFFSEEDYLHAECDEAIEALVTGDAAWLSEVGDGDVQDLLSMTDWSNAEYERDYKFAADGEPENGFVRYIVTSGDEEYMLGFKFEGEGMANDESCAVLTGIAACPYSVWDEYDASDSDGWDKLIEAVDGNSVVIGDDRFFSYSILLW